MSALQERIGESPLFERLRSACVGIENGKMREQMGSSDFAELVRLATLGMLLDPQLQQFGVEASIQARAEISPDEAKGVRVRSAVSVTSPFDGRLLVSGRLVNDPTTTHTMISHGAIEVQGLDEGGHTMAAFPQVRERLGGSLSSPNTLVFTGLGALLAPYHTQLTGLTLRQVGDKVDFRVTSVSNPQQY